jgi:hypothetical protein
MAPTGPPFPPSLVVERYSTNTFGLPLLGAKYYLKNATCTHLHDSKNYYQILDKLVLDSIH